MCSDMYMFRSGTNMLLLNKRNNTKVVLMGNSIQFVCFWRPHNLFCYHARSLVVALAQYATLIYSRMVVNNVGESCAFNSQFNDIPPFM